MKTRKRRRRTTGASLALLLLAVSVTGSAAKPPVQTPAVVAGTVFRDPGFALPRAEVSLSVKTPPQGMKPPKPQKLLSDARGEFAFHVPAAQAEYLVKASAPGFLPEEKVAVLSGAPERVDLFFSLKPANTQ